MQVNAYATLVEEHLELFVTLTSVLLKREVVLVAPCEKWIVWPVLSSGEPREDELAEARIMVVGYEQVDGEFGEGWRQGWS